MSAGASSGAHGADPRRAPGRGPPSSPGPRLPLELGQLVDQVLVERRAPEWPTRSCPARSLPRHCWPFHRLDQGVQVRLIRLDPMQLQLDHGDLGVSFVGQIAGGRRLGVNVIQVRQQPLEHIETATTARATNPSTSEPRMSKSFRRSMILYRVTGGPRSVGAWAAGRQCPSCANLRPNDRRCHKPSGIPQPGKAGTGPRRALERLPAFEVAIHRQKHFVQPQAQRCCQVGSENQGVIRHGVAGRQPPHLLLRMGLFVVVER